MWWNAQQAGSSAESLSYYAPAQFMDNYAAQQPLLGCNSRSHGTGSRLGGSPTNPVANLVSVSPLFWLTARSMRGSYQPVDRENLVCKIKTGHRCVDW